MAGKKDSKNTNNSGYSRNKRTSASDKIAEQRRRKTALEDFQSPRLSGGKSSNKTPRLSTRSNGASSLNGSAARSRTASNRTASNRSTTASRRKSENRNIQVIGGTGSGSYVSKKSVTRPIFSKKKTGISGGKIAVGVVVLFFVIVVLFMLTNKNGVEVFVDGNSMGIVLDKDFSEEYIKSTCSAKLVANLGTNVQITSEIKAKKVHTSKNNEKVATSDYMTKTITDAITYNVEATVISVNGKEMAIVANEEAAQSVQDQILSGHKLSYIADTSSIVEGPEIQGIELSTKYVDGSEIMTNDQAYEVLNSTKTEQKTYIIQAGDSFGTVASMYGVSTAEVQAANPNLDPAALCVGDEVKVNATVPVLDIKVVTQTIDKSSGSSVVVKTTYINGVETDSSALNSNDDTENNNDTESNNPTPSSNYSDDEDIADKVAQDGGSY